VSSLPGLLPLVSSSSSLGLSPNSISSRKPSSISQDWGLVAAYECGFHSALCTALLKQLP
jgi:hypothetical protein